MRATESSALSTIEPLPMSRPTRSPKDATGLMFGLEDRPDFATSLVGAIQHVLASAMAIVMPTLVIGQALGLSREIPHLVSMSLIVSGIGTFIQSHRVGPVGSGLLSLQGTSFSFVGPIVAAGEAYRASGHTPQQILAVIFGICLAGCLVEVGISQFIMSLKRIITPAVTGSIITVIGLSLVKISFTDLVGGTNPPSSGGLTNLAVGFLVVAVIVYLSVVQNFWLRISAMMTGVIIGFAVSWWLGMVDFSQLDGTTWIAVPQPLKYGLAFDWVYFVPIVLVYLITTIETTGDLTANSVIAGEPVEGDLYLSRIQGGVLGDGVNSGLAALFNTFPNTTFSQNNGVIQVTGIASRHLAAYIAVILIALGLFPALGSALQLIPRPVIGGATFVLFGSIAVAGIRILASQPFERKQIFVVALSLGCGLGVAMVPDVLQPLPKSLSKVFESPITTSGALAILATLLLPDGPTVEALPEN
jgi:xanthine permease XanP